MGCGDGERYLDAVDATAVEAVVEGKSSGGETIAVDDEGADSDSRAK